MRKLIIIAASIAALAIPTAALASVAVDGTGNGFVGKGDVQTALGYGNGNDTAFQKDARSATFTLKSTTLFKAVGVKCGVAVDGVIDPSTIHAIDVTMGTTGTTTKAVKSDPKITGNKVTGYNLTGTGAVISQTFDWNVDWNIDPTASCPSGETFVEFGYSFSNNFTSAGDLTVSIGEKSAALPNTAV